MKEIRMCQWGRKAPRLMRKKDRLIDLPDGILSTIISMLTLKEAVRTSVLSKRWRYIWTCHSDLWFDSINVIGHRVHSNSISTNQPEWDGQLQRCKFVERVDQFMHQRCEGPRIDSLAIHFHLGREFASHIDQWINSAVTKGAESIDLDLSEWCSFRVDHNSSTASECYEFPCWLPALAGRRCTVKHLRLASCCLGDHPSSNSLLSLITIKLREVNISDQQLKNLLSNCPFLEGLSLHQCKDLVNLDFSGPSKRMKFLNIQNCFRLKQIEIDAENLVIFEYTGPLVCFSFKNVPKLAEAFLDFTGETRLDGVTYALTKFASDLPQLETLYLLSILVMKTLKLPENGPTFANIKQLMVTVYPFHDEDQLCWISYILKAFPLLQKLQLNLFSPIFLKQPKDIERRLPECFHKHLTEVEINGFYGNQHEAVLLKYLLDNLVLLKAIVVSPRQKVYKGCNHWIYEEASSWYKSRLQGVCEWLHSVVPPTVHLEVR
ncbi:hypothetical protein L1049_016509 [Liquidambar formosana]|uniref:F-box domain-containing protein n=1 Tax=Liquidambar formosana TaxID=63359 RepID=A0AAP0RZG5_LIQFO